MVYLLSASIIWAFSFGIIKYKLSNIDPYLISSLRLLIAFLSFLPFTNVKKLSKDLKIKLFFIGALQFGLMYICYIQSFKYLLSSQVAFLTIFTPFYVTFFNDIINRNINIKFLIGAIIAIISSIIIMKFNPSLELKGFILVQLSNLFFASGQILYKHTLKDNSYKDIQIIGYLYFGAFIITTIPLISINQPLKINLVQFLYILYLGLIPSGISFYLWATGTRKVNAGTLAIMNNIKIPLSIMISILFFSEKTDLFRLFLSFLFIYVALYIVKDKQILEKSLKIIK